MQANFNILFPHSFDFEVFGKSKSSKVFNDNAIEFLSDLAASLLNDRESRIYPDVITFAYFCRKGNLLKLKMQYVENNILRLGRGIVFHIAPSNVPINFGYSLVVGMLAGNVNVVRVSSKQFPQVDLVIKHMNKIAKDDKHKDIVSSTVIVRYDRESEANALFSSMAAVRMIWGGDTTIATIRKNELPPRSFDVCFADRYSIALINPEAITTADDSEMKRLANGFYNDTYLFDQNACSAPHVIFWLNAPNIKKAQSKFWKYVHELASEKYNLQPVLAVDKLTAFYTQAILTHIRKEMSSDNIVVRNTLIELPTDIEKYRCAGGYFGEYIINNLSEILPIVSPRYQTLAYYGFSPVEMRTFVESNTPSGIDRIVPIGTTTNFSLTWDGYNLIDTLSRIVSILP